jgi:hypothetical protein
MLETQIKLIKEAKYKISALGKEQDKIYNDLILALGITENETNNHTVLEWIFDAVYNSGESNEEFMQHIEAIEKAMAAGGLS